MIILVVAVLMNGGLLAGLVALLLYVFLPESSLLSTSIHLTLTCSFGLISGLVGLGLTPAADILFRSLCNLRRPIQAEEDRFRPLFKEVCFSAKVRPQDYALRMCDDRFPTAFALGRNTVALSRGLLATSTNEEIQGILAHEVGHIHHGDTIRLNIFCMVSFVGQAALICIGIAGSFLIVLARIPLLGLLSLLLGVLLKFLVWLIETLLLLPLALGQAFSCRQQEYRADGFAIQIGHGDGLHSFLSKTLDMDGCPSGIYGLLWRTHPKIGDRISKLEQAGIAP